MTKCPTLAAISGFSCSSGDSSTANTPLFTFPCSFSSIDLLFFLLADSEELLLLLPFSSWERFFRAVFAAANNALLIDEVICFLDEMLVDVAAGGGS